MPWVNLALSSLLALEASIAILPFKGGTEAQNCQEHFHRIILEESELGVLPLWYSTGHPISKLRTEQQQIQFWVEGKVSPYQNKKQISLFIQDAHQNIVFADSRQIPATKLNRECQKLAYDWLGKSIQEPVKSPALAASLSLIAPGSGHFYSGEWSQILLGSLYLGAFLGLSTLAFSGNNHSMTRSQIGGTLLLLSLSDIITAYFLTQENH